MSGDAAQSSHLRIVGALAGVGSGLTKVAVGHGDLVFVIEAHSTPICKASTLSKPECNARHLACTVARLMSYPKRSETRFIGFLALYKGATPPAVMWAAIDSVLLGSLHNYRLYLFRLGMTERNASTQQQRLTIFAHGLAGLSAGMTSTILATPMELIKVTLQLQTQKSSSERQFKGPVDCARKIVRLQGIGGLWSGFTGTVACRANFFWLFLSFEALMRGFSTLHGTPYELNTGVANFMAGGLSSFAFWIMAIPADNVKNRMMAFPYPSPYPTSLTSTSPPQPFTRPSFASVARQIHAQEGYRGFVRGLGPCLLRAFPVNASAFFVYEGLLRILGAEKTRN